LLALIALHLATPTINNRITVEQTIIATDIVRNILIFMAFDICSQI